MERQWYRYLILCLSEDDARWVETNLAPSLDWEAVTSAFTRQFSDPYRLREARLSLFKLQMRPGETIGEYSRRFEDHMRLADVPDAERGVATYFLSTLPHALRYHIDSAISQLEEPEPTVKQLISIALSFTWKPSEAKAPVRGEGPKAHSVPADASSASCMAWVAMPPSSAVRSKHARYAPTQEPRTSISSAPRVLQPPRFRPRRPPRSPATVAAREATTPTTAA